jgi:CHAT domain-containing protein
LVLRAPEGRVWRLADGTFRIAPAAPDSGARPVDSVDEVGRYLADRLLEPLAPVLRGRRTWLIVPDGELALLPFDALPFDGGRVLAKHDVGYIASISVLALLRERASRPRAARVTRELLAVGAPDYATAKASEPQTEVALRYRSLGVTWSPLPGALREVNAVARSFPAGQTLLLTGGNASEARLSELNEAGDLKGFRYLHFATHGYLSPNSPQLSAVVLSQVGNPRGVDGYLTAAEWVGYDLDSDLIVLSGCNTGVGDRVQGEGVTGLPYALVLAGNRSTMLTLWPVVDDSAARLVVGVFAGIRRGQAPLRALADAKRGLSSRSRTADPLHWAAFVYYGR